MPIFHSSFASISSHRRVIAGVLLLAMICLTIIRGFQPDNFIGLYWLSGAIAFSAALLLIADTGFGPRLQVSILMLTGVALLLVAHQRGVDISFIDAISRNTGLLTMILSVGFLKMIVINDLDKVSELPVGKRAFRNTLIGVGVFGSVINISAPIVICDRLAMQAPVGRFTAKVITRVFCACASWSPYFAGAAVVLTYVEGVHLIQIMSNGLPFLLLAIAVVYGLALRFDADRVDRFHGYPISLSSLWIPALLTVLVIVTNYLLPALSILTVIALSALALTTGVLTWRQGRIVSSRRLLDYVKNGLPASVNELLLFLAAGVLAAGLAGLVDAGLITLSLTTFSVLDASLLLAVMILISALGIHPVIQIAGLTPLVLTANPDPDLLALTYLFAWSLGTCASPLSGTHLIFQGRYGIPAWLGALQNWSYVALMYVIAVVLLQIHVILS